MADSRTRSKSAVLGWITRRANIAAREVERERRSAAAVLGHKRRRERLAVETGSAVKEPTRKPAKKKTAKKKAIRRPSEPTPLPSPPKKKKRKPAKKKAAKKKAAKKRPSRRRPSAEEWAVEELPPEVEPAEPARPGLTLAQLEKDYNARKYDKAMLTILRLNELEAADGDDLKAEEYLQLSYKIDLIIGDIARQLREARLLLANKKASAEIPRPPEYYGDIAWEELAASEWTKREEKLREQALNTELAQVIYAIDKSDLNTIQAVVLLDLRDAAMKGDLNERILQLLEESDEFTAKDYYTLYFTSLTP